MVRLLVSLLSIALLSTTNAFVQQTSNRGYTKLSMAKNVDNSRRRAFETLLVGGIGLVGSVALPQEASASYSAYAAREKDWDERMDKGEIKITTARDLRRQLAEIAPMNSEGAKIFCPNGPSAAVTPLMENRCSDIRMAAPSVYGRSTDMVGNSIPGFNYNGARSIPGGSGQVMLSADPLIGGMPKYK